MKQVTFEEALEIIRNNITQAYIYACYNKSTKQNTGVLEEQTHRMVKVLEEQHKPPTWDEVQKALKDAYPMSDVYQIGNTILVDFEERRVQGICVENNQVYISNYRTEMHTTEYEAINLTIRYLEAQKHHDL